MSKVSIVLEEQGKDHKKTNELRAIYVSEVLKVLKIKQVSLRLRTEWTEDLKQFIEDLKF